MSTPHAITWTKGPPQTWEAGDKFLVRSEYESDDLLEMLSLDEDGIFFDPFGNRAELTFSDIAWHIPERELLAAIPKG